MELKDSERAEQIAALFNRALWTSSPNTAVEYGKLTASCSIEHLRATGDPVTLFEFFSRTAAKRIADTLLDVPHSDEVYMVMFANIFTSDVWEAVLPEAMKNSPKLPLPEEGNLAARLCKGLMERMSDLSPEMKKRNEDFLEASLAEATVKRPEEAPTNVV
ncbi:hypothetical protein EMWEY_00053830 [Eimeria maxima]|uniref:Uncharacterized protein n=1 Tax=Eimeria maxima TaxID=5804 RepID=U6MB17_EIMMA|nr:hypothetical protein EMWEY_00053830 [Eimeria maxima]CDJ58860.1 hypothetical protein EMWEY_00053830 [Eimeria maxima]